MEETCGYHSHQYVIDENKPLPIRPQSTISSPHCLDYDKTEQQQEFNQQSRKNPSVTRWSTSLSNVRMPDGNSGPSKCRPTKEIGCLSKLDHPENLKKIIGRLPFGMRLKWRDAVDRIVENEGRDVTIKDVTSFVTARARAGTHPVFGRVVNEGRGKQRETQTSIWSKSKRVCNARRLTSPQQSRIEQTN
ncbi:Hypothetical predicted protein [Paramuricea clavata]|uniref:Uncharacterized protein n=1 Tax=Paramuricea clavata TaxID=317549 RepID=A0A6S7JYQ0_PARCT|nr:Hypothetical predicted protein [Paramuricea clavata]